MFIYKQKKYDTTLFNAFFHLMYRPLSNAIFIHLLISVLTQFQKSKSQGK